VADKFVAEGHGKKQGKLPEHKKGGSSPFKLKAKGK
jgi:hypothetical protein